MQKELPYFLVEDACGGSQKWFPDEWMRIGGCGAVTFCDVCLWLDLYRGTKLYPFDARRITREDYLRFGMLMKPYLRPRPGGIDRLELYIDGAAAYLADRHEASIHLAPFPGESSAEAAWEAVRTQIGLGYPIPCLMLKHQDPALDEYVWHWFLITGWRERDGRREAKIVTYGSWRWLDFPHLWDTGFEQKGGLILLRQDQPPSGEPPAAPEGADGTPGRKTP